MRLLTVFLLTLPFYSLCQSKADEKPFPMRNGKIHYETSFALQIPKDTLFQRAEDWIRNQREINQVIYKTTLIDSTGARRLLKGMVGFTQPTKPTATKTGKSVPNKVTYIYNLRVYLRNETIVTLIIDELTVTGNLPAIGLSSSYNEKDTLYVANYVSGPQSGNPAKARASQNLKKAMNESYKQADAYLKANIRELVVLLHKRPEEVVPEK